MRIERPSSVGIITFVLMLTAAGCVTSGARPAAGGGGGVCIDGLLVEPGQHSLEEILERRFARRIPQWFDPRLPGPLVLVDGRAVDGIHRLALLTSDAVASVETLDGNRAVPEYGLPARDGAIVVLTKRGRADGAGVRPGTRPPLYCGNDGV